MRHRILRIELNGTFESFNPDVAVALAKARLERGAEDEALEAVEGQRHGLRLAAGELAREGADRVQLHLD
mgnify:CR=1 FL=1